jgi:hypothetical protein
MYAMSRVTLHSGQVCEVTFNPKGVPVLVKKVIAHNLRTTVWTSEGPDAVDEYGPMAAEAISIAKARRSAK